MSSQESVPSVNVILAQAPQGDRIVLLVAECDGIRYALHASSMQVSSVQEVQGIMVLDHPHRGGGSHAQELIAEHIGKEDFDLDPICRALRARGWSEKMLGMQVRRPGTGYISRIWTDWSEKQDTPVKSSWDGSGGDYFICGPSTHRDHADARWCIRVGEGQPRSVSVAVPHVYSEPEQLETLLAAIQSLPHVDEFDHVHPVLKK